MADLSLRLYHALPPLLRNAVASVRGRQLQRLRYGADTERLVADAHARELWTAAQWQAWRDERLAAQLHRAATRVPFYREQWQARRRAGDKASWELLANWPLLDKEIVRQQPRAFVADDRDVRTLVRDNTSGTSGTSLTLWIAPHAVQVWYALFEARWRRWYGVSLADRWAILGGQMVVPAEQRSPPYWVWNSGMRQLYLSAYHVAPRTARDYAQALREHGVRYLLGYPSGMHALAQVLLEQGAPPLSLQLVLTNAEPVLAYQRESMMAAFGAPVRETYGMAETLAAASECEHGKLHLWPETGVHEVLSQGESVPPGDLGELVATGLLNPDMPLVRYRVGDRVALAADVAQCDCGRTLPVLQQVDGRVDDVVYTPDGRAIGRLDPVFKGGLPVREAQIVQESLHRLRVLVVPAPEWDAAAAASIVKRLRDRVGDLRVDVETCESIPRTRNGKFKAVVSRVTPPLPSID